MSFSFDLSRLKKARVLVLGDVMVDEYLWGEVERISPEAPVPVVAVSEQTRVLGGAGNVVNNLMALGARVSVVSMVGEGATGKSLVRLFAEQGVGVGGLLPDPKRRTTRKTRVMAGTQQVVRVDRETVGEISPEQAHELCSVVERRLPDTDVVLVSDYGKGVVSRLLLARLFKLCKASGTPVIVDPKGPDYSKYRGATALTPNFKEAGEILHAPLSGIPALMEQGDGVLNDLNLRHLLVTCGKDGMVLFSRDGEPLRIHSRAWQVFDVSGAGDTVLAVLGLCVAAGASFPEAARVANEAAGVVVGKVGTATVSEAELASALNQSPDPSADKSKTLEDLVPLLDQLRRQGKKIVLTNGCFDLLHAGHVLMLAASRRLGDCLVVALDDDASVSGLKGPGRPVIGERQRVRIMSALDSVDYVVVFSSRDLPKVISAVRPHVLTKGSNLSTERVEGRDLVERLGGRVELIPVDERHSSDRIIRAIQNGRGGEEDPS